MSNKLKHSGKGDAIPMVAMSQKDIPTLLEKVNAQILELKGGMTDVPKTDAQLPGFGKVEQIASVEELIKAASSVMGKKEAYDKASALVVPEGFKVPEFTICEIKANVWLDHIRSRIVIVANKTRLETLNKIKSTLEENLSAEAKLANDLNKIQDMLGETI